MSGKRLTLDQAKRFWSKVNIGSPDSCWPWLASTNGSYGQVMISYQRCCAHRVAYEETYGAIPDGQFICHQCDNPLCCNPSHLFSGTHAENMDDAKRKGRLHRNMMPENVQALRDLYATRRFTMKQLAAKYGVSESAVCLVVNNKRWRHP